MPVGNMGNQTHGYNEISPTFISTDLLSPDYMERITNPMNGMTRTPLKPIGVKTWGESLTAYGGIGCLPFLGKTKFRDLDVVRKHHHFNSGFSTYTTNIQPYRVTTLRLSDCRMNDQRLPAPFNVYLDPTKLPIKTGIPIIPYFSHTCINEMIPFCDPNRSNANGAKILTEGTSKTLAAYYRHLYETPRYNEIYPEHPPRKPISHDGLKDDPLNVLLTSSKHQKIFQSINMMPLLARLCVISRDRPILYSPLMKFLLDHLNEQNEESMRGLYKAIRCLYHLAYSETARQLNINLSDYPLEAFRDIFESNMSLDEKVVNICSAFIRFCEKLAEEQSNVQTNEQNSLTAIKTRPVSTSYARVKSGKCRPASSKRLPSCRPTSPKWPPSKCYTLDHKHMKLRSVDILHDITPGKVYKARKLLLEKRGPRIDQEHMLECGNSDHEVQSIENGLSRYKKYLDTLLPVPFDNREGHQKLNILPGLSQKEPNKQDTFKEYEAVDGLACRTNLPLVPLSECLPKAGNRIQDKLGLQYKTEAHKRFHAQYPDEVPDLRDNIRNTKRRVFFYGHHSSSFRG